MHLTAASLNATAFVKGRVAPFVSYLLFVLFKPTLAGLIPPELTSGSSPMALSWAQAWAGSLEPGLLSVGHHGSIHVGCGEDGAGCGFKDALPL